MPEAVVVASWLKPVTVRLFRVVEPVTVSLEIVVVANVDEPLTINNPFIVVVDKVVVPVTEKLLLIVVEPFMVVVAKVEVPVIVMLVKLEDDAVLIICPFQ